MGWFTRSDPDSDYDRRNRVQQLLRSNREPNYRYGRSPAAGVDRDADRIVGTGLSVVGKIIRLYLKFVFFVLVLTAVGILLIIAVSGDKNGHQVRQQTMSPFSDQEKLLSVDSHTAKKSLEEQLYVPGFSTNAPPPRRTLEEKMYVPGFSNNPPEKPNVQNGRPHCVPGFSKPEDCN